MAKIKETLKHIRQTWLSFLNLSDEHEEADYTDTQALPTQHNRYYT